MQQIYPNHWFRGYNRLMNYISDIDHLSPKDQLIIQERIRIIKFFDEYGEKATKEAFYRSRSTIYLWKKIIRESGGRLSSLRHLTKAPKTRSKRVVQLEHISFIKEYRQEHPRRNVKIGGLF